MPSAVKFGSGTSTTTGFNVGSVFGLSQDVMNAPVLLAHGEQGAGNFDPNGPRGQSHDTVGTVVQQVSAFYHLSAEERQGAIEQLIEAGYLAAPAKGKKLQPQAAESAWKDAVLEAARAGTTVIDILDQRKQEQAALGLGAGSAKPPLTVKLTNPSDLHYIFDQVAQHRLGKNVPAGWVDGMVAAYQAQESAAQHAVYNDAATVTAAPDPTSFADAQIKQRDPGGVASNDFLGRANDFFSLLQGPVHG